MRIAEIRINEIFDPDKSYLRIKGVRYSFEEDYNNILSAYPLIGSSVGRRNILLSDTDIVCSYINLFLEQQFENIDSDIIAAKDIYNKLLEIKNKL